MARKAPAESSSAHSFKDVIGVILLAAALLLLVAQFSFDRYDLSFIRNPPNKPAHNWIGPLGAYLAFSTFLVCGVTAYALPVVLAFFALGCWFEPLSYLKRRWFWAVILVVSCMGWLHLLDLPHLKDNSMFSRARIAMSAPSIGGFVGRTMYDYFFWMLGPIGAGIVYGDLDLIILLFLTNFQLGEWIRTVRGLRKARIERQPTDSKPATAEEVALERRARELRKQAKQLEEEVARSGLGPDLKP